MMIRHPRLLRTAAVSILAVMLVAGCAGTSDQPSVVTVTSTVPPAPAGGAASSPAGSAAGGEAGQAAPGTAPTGAPSASPVEQGAGGSSTPAKRRHSGPPRTITVGRPTIPDPAEAGSSGDPAGSSDQSSGSGGTADGSAAGGASAGHTDRPPGSLSTDGDLIAAATSAAAAAGVPPADPDAPGPDSGPRCSANKKYVNEKPTGLRTDVITAWRKAVSVAAAQGITLCLNDGKRSRAQQQAQYDQYVQQYGEQVADQLVLPPNKSAHVIGIAIDVQPANGYRWLQSTDGSLGFCRIYDNEAWHFEFNPEYRSTGCPARLPEPER